jgi:hypothetical protein
MGYEGIVTPKLILSIGPNLLYFWSQKLMTAPTYHHQRPNSNDLENQHCFNPRTFGLSFRLVRAKDEKDARTDPMILLMRFAIRTIRAATNFSAAIY